MITEDYVSLETAKLLKEKGFDSENVSEFGGFYVDYFHNGQDVGIATESMMLNKTLSDWEYLRPTLQMAMKWLREMGWFICIIPLSFYCGEKVTRFGYNIWAGDNLEIDEFDTPKFNTYEEAAESAIKYCLEKLI